MSDGPDTTRVLLTIDEAAERLGICRRTLQDHVKDGAIKYIVVGRGKVRRWKRFHEDDIQAFIDAQRTTECVMPVELRTAGRRRVAPAVAEEMGFLEERAIRLGRAPLPYNPNGVGHRNSEEARLARIASGHWKTKSGRRHQQPR